MQPSRFEHKNSKFIEQLCPSSLRSQVNHHLSTLTLREEDSDEFSVIFADENPLLNFKYQLTQNLIVNKTSPRRFFTPIAQPSHSHDSIPLGLINTIDSEKRPYLNSLTYHFWSLVGSQPSDEPPPVNLLLLGANQLYDIHSLLGVSQSRPINIIVADCNPSSLAVFFSLVDITSLIALLRERGIGLTFLIHEDPQSLTYALQRHILYAEPTIVYHLQVLSPLIPSADMLSFEAWINSSQGLKVIVDLLYGNETDEINQTINFLVNTNPTSCSFHEPSLLKRALPHQSKHDADHAVILTASGPSLDHSLDEIKVLSRTLPVVAAGSSVTTLLLHGIHVDVCVLLETGSIIYYSILDSLRKGVTFKNTILIASTGIDPRISRHFKQTFYFQRPSLSLQTLFKDIDNLSMLPQAGPQVINAALEYCLELGTKQFYTFGCDFSAPSPSAPRSQSAFGFSSRRFDLPVSSLLGNTIFSDAELLVTAEFFDNILSLYGALAFTTTDTVSINNIRYLDKLPTHSLPSNSRSTFFALLQENSSDLSSSSLRSDLIDSLNQSSHHLDNIFSSLSNTLSKAQCWDRDVQNHINQLLSYNSTQYESTSLAFFRCQLRSLLLHLLRPLSSDSSVYHTYRPSLLSSLQLLQTSLNIFYKTTFEILSDSLVSYQWSPGELKSALRSSFISHDVDPL